jgi:hypothetical protein
MADPKPLEETVDNFIEAWEKFLLDELNTEQVTDYIILMLKAREAQDSSDGTFELL